MRKTLLPIVYEFLTFPFRKPVPCLYMLLLAQARVLAIPAQNPAGVIRSGVGEDLPNSVPMPDGYFSPDGFGNVFLYQKGGNIWDSAVDFILVQSNSYLPYGGKDKITREQAAIIVDLLTIDRVFESAADFLKYEISAVHPERGEYSGVNLILHSKIDRGRTYQVKGHENCYKLYLLRSGNRPERINKTPDCDQNQNTLYA